MSDDTAGGTEGLRRETAEVLIEEWRMAASDERGERDGASIYREVAAELEAVLES